MDGTLGDTLYICVEGMRRAAEPIAGRKFSDADIWASFGPSEEGSLPRIAPQDPEKCLRDYLRYYEELHQAVTEPFEGIKELLSDLKKEGFLLALVTGKGRHTLEISMRVMGLNGYFDEIRWGCLHGPCKPEKIKEVVATWGVDPKDVGYVGDVKHDIVSAREAGTLAVSVAWAPEANAVELASGNPDVLCSSVAEFKEWVKKSRQ